MGTRDVSSSTTRYAFNLLDNTNWEAWSYKVEAKLEDEDRWKFIIGPWVFPTITVQRPAVSPATGMVDEIVTNPAYADWCKGDEKTKRRIIEMVNDDQIAYIRDT
jgi:mevalonate pyrophosphate decarboxylase